MIYDEFTFAAPPAHRMPNLRLSLCGQNPLPGYTAEPPADPTDTNAREQYDHDVHQAKQQCLTCPELAVCAAWVASSDEDGVWAGTTAAERDAARTGRRPLRLEVRVTVDDARNDVRLANRLTRTGTPLNGTGMDKEAIGAKYGRSGKSIERETARQNAHARTVEQARTAGRETFTEAS